MAQWFKAKVADKQELASKFLWVHLELVVPDRMEFTAGQYVMMRIPGEQGLKQYSIVSAPSTNHGMELLVDVAPQGLGSKYLQSLEPGDEVEFMGPAGRFVIDTSVTEPELWFVATGSGISSIKSVIWDLLIDKKDHRPMWLHWGLRYPEDIFWFSELAELAEEYDNFTFDPVLSRPSGGWKFCQGHVTECVVKHHQDFSKAAAYLCGNKGMIEEVSKMLQEKGMAAERIHHEEYY